MDRVFQYLIKVPFKSLNDNGIGLIPTPTRLRFRVNRPYAPYTAVDTTTVTNPRSAVGQASNPYYTFSTKGLNPIKKVG